MPFVQQMASAECGAACLAMVLGYYGKTLSVNEIRDVMGIGRDGTSAKTIVEAARLYGLRARGASIDVSQLEHLPIASIVHWGFNHFVVFERFHGNMVDILDPAFGRRRMALSEARKHFTGVVMLFEPSNTFEPGEKRKPRIWYYLRQALAYSGHLPKILITSLLLQLFALALPVLTGALVDRVVPRTDSHLLLVIVIGLAALVIFYFMASMIRAHLLLHLRTLFDVRSTLDFLDHLISLPFAFFQRRSTGDLMARVNSNSTIREIFTAGTLSGVLDGGLVLLYLVLLFVASPTLAVVVVALALLQGTVVALSRRRQRELLAQNLHIQARADGYLVQLLAGMETLKVMGSEDKAALHWNELFVDVLNVSLSRGRLNAVVDSLTATLRMASPLCVLSCGALLVMRGDLSLGSMLALNALAVGFFAPLSSLVATAGQLQLLASYVARIEDVLQTEPEQDLAKVQQPPPLRGRIELDHVSFRYAPMSPMVVKDVSVTIEPGEFVAIVGRSGSGKSTLASLLVGLYAPASGRSLYDGIDMAQLAMRALRRQVTMVPQQPYLFGSSIRSNIALTNPRMPLNEVVQAARMACIHEDIEAMPMRYDTVLADGGASLSGGQRQRMVLARALAIRPVVLVLDEATSALDAITENKVQESLASLQCTRVVVAHRMSTVRQADRILVMDGGNLIEQGTHEELVRLGGLYASVVAAQLSQEPAEPAEP